MAPTLPVGEKVEPFDGLFLQLGAFSAFSNAFGDGVFSDAGADELVGDQDGWAITGRASFLPWVDAPARTAVWSTWASRAPTAAT